MRNDLYYGAIISLGIHFGIANLNPARTERIVPVRATEKTVYIPIPLKPEDLVADQRSGDVKEKMSTPDIPRPPSQPDVPQIVQPDTFVVPIQPATDGPIDRKLTTLPKDFGKSSGGFGGTFETLSLDQQPVVKFQAKPVYPYDMKRTDQSGEVMVDFIVDETGAVRNAYAVRSTHREFESAAVQAVSKWKFRPGKKGGRAVNTHMQVPIVFHLGQEGA